MNDADRQFIQTMVNSNNMQIQAAAKVIRDGDDRTIRAFAQNEAAENKTENSALQAVLKGQQLTPEMQSALADKS